MKNALLLLSVWVAIIVAAYGMVYWDRGIEPPLPTSVLEPADTPYSDPGGRFSLVVPADWVVEAAAEAVRLTDPAGAIEASVRTSDEAIPESALLAAFAVGALEGDAEAFVVETIPAAGASERAVRMTLPSADGTIRYGLAYLYEGETVVVTVSGTEQAIARRAADLDRIEASIEVPAASAAEPTSEEAEPIVEL